MTSEADMTRAMFMSELGAAGEGVAGGAGAAAAVATRLRRWPAARQATGDGSPAYIDEWE